MGKIKFHATMAGVSLLLNSGERNVAAIKAKSESHHISVMTMWWGL